MLRTICLEEVVKANIPIEPISLALSDKKQKKKPNHPSAATFNGRLFFDEILKPTRREKVVRECVGVWRERKNVNRSRVSSLPTSRADCRRLPVVFAAATYAYSRTRIYSHLDRAN